MESIAKHVRSCLASLTLAAMGMTFIVAPTAKARLDFTDNLEIPTWAEEAIEELIDQGVIAGNDDGSFAPNRQLNRAEVSKVIVLASGIEFDTAGGPHFPDVDDGAWYYDYVETMYNQGWINGYPDGKFRPSVGINRAEIAKMVVNAFGIEQDLSGAPHFDDVSSSDWYYGYVETAYNNGLMRGYGDGSFGPANAVTRAETVKITYDGQLVVAEPMGPAEGTLEVVLSDDTPRGTNIPYNATSVPFTTVEFTASDDSDIEISSLTFTRLGLGDNDDFDNVWLEIDGFKIGNDKSINNDDIVELRFNPPIVVPAGQTLVADVVTSAKYTETTDENTGHHNRLALVSADDVVTTAANIVGDFPIEGEEMEVADYQVSSVEFGVLGSDTNVDVGDNFIEIGKFKLENATSTNKDVELRAITFKNDGTAEIEDDLENVALYVSGEQISAETIIDGDYITFRLDNGVTGGYIIEDGDSKIFSIRADVVSAESGDNITLKIDNFEDIVGVEIGTSFGIKALAGSGWASTATCASGTSNAEDSCATLKTYSIDSGDLNISRDPASPGNQTYSPGSNDVVFLTARIVVDQPLIVDGLRIDVDTSTALGTDTIAEANTNFDNFRLYLNDRLVDSENDFTGTTTATAENGYLDFNTTFEIAGTSILKVVGNIASDADTGDKLKLEIEDGDSFSSPEYISTGDQVSSNQVLGSATGSFIEVQTSVLTATRTDGLSDGDKIVAGVDDVEFMKFVLDNNDSGDANVTSMTVSGSATGESRTYTQFTVAVFVDGTQQGSAKNLDTNGDATFNDLSVIIPTSGQKEFVVVVDTIEDSAKAQTDTLSDTAACANDYNGSFDNSAGSDTILVSSTFYAELTDGDTLYYDSGTTASGAITKGNADATCTTLYEVAIATSTPGAAGDVDGKVFELIHTFELDVEDVDADNVDNGSEITVTTDGSTAVSSSNAVDGATFELVQSGELTVSTGSTVYSDILVANASNVEILKIRFNAADDEVQIQDIYLENDTDGDGTPDDTSATGIGARLDLKLYNEAGQLIQTEQMTNGYVHFELGNQDRIRVPKDDSTFVTVKADIRDITKANQTGKQLLLALDADGSYDSNSTGADESGIEAVTAATGTDLAAAEISGDAAGQEFVAYRTQISVKHAATQPNFSDPSTASQEVYRFTVSSDSARQTEIGRATLSVTLQGMESEATGLSFDVKQVKSDGAVDSTATIATVTDDSTGTTDTSATVTIEFSNQQLSAGESRTYALFLAETEQLTSSTVTDDDSVSVTIVRDSNYSQAGTKANLQNNGAADTSSDPTTAGNADGVLVWSDESDPSHSDTTSDWLNGYLVDIDTTAKVNED